MTLSNYEYTDIFSVHVPGVEDPLVAAHGNTMNITWTSTEGIRVVAVMYRVYVKKITRNEVVSTPYGYLLYTKSDTSVCCPGGATMKDVLLRAINYSGYTYRYDDNRSFVFESAAEPRTVSNQLRSSLSAVYQADLNERRRPEWAEMVADVPEFQLDDVVDVFELDETARSTHRCVSVEFESEVMQPVLVLHTKAERGSASSVVALLSFISVTTSPISIVDSGKPTILMQGRENKWALGVPIHNMYTRVVSTGDSYRLPLMLDTSSTGGYIFKITPEAQELLDSLPKFHEHHGEENDAIKYTTQYLEEMFSRSS